MLLIIFPLASWLMYVLIMLYLGCKHSFFLLPMLGEKESCGENVKCVVMHESHFGRHDTAKLL